MYHSLVAPSRHHTILIHNRDRSRSFAKHVTSAPVKAALLLASMFHSFLTQEQRLEVAMCDSWLKKAKYLL